MEYPRENPLLKPFSVPPFKEIEDSDFKPAILRAMAIEKKNIQEIRNSRLRPTFYNTVAALDLSGLALEKVESTFFNLLAANSSPEKEKLAEELAPLLSAHSNSIMQDRKLFSRIRFVWKYRIKKLTPEQNRLIDTVYDDFIRSGALLNADEKKQLRDTEEALSTLGVKFAANLLHARAAFSLNTEDRSRLDGVPATVIAAAEKAAAENDHSGLDLTLDEPVYFPVMAYCSDRDIRRSLYMARNSACMDSSPYDNREICEQIVNLRLRKANLLGYKCYADYVLQKRLAGTAGRVYSLLRDIRDAYLPVARRETEEVERFAQEKEGGGFRLMPWDFAYYSRLLKHKLFGLEDEMLRPYFELSGVERGIFALANKLYGIMITPDPDTETYSPDVKAWRVDDVNGRPLGVLLTDYFSRKEKQSGAWTTEYSPQYIYGENNVRPVVSIVMNFPRPCAGKPSLLNFGEVTTFLHEFGHALHALFSDTTYISLSGTRVYRDFVELPSQIMENFAYEKNFLLTFARHYITGQPLPEELIEKILRSRNFHAGYAAIRQISFALIDMALHTITSPLSGNLMEVEKSSIKDISLLPEVEGTGVSVHFSHIMDGGYAAGYYNYKWSEMLDADAFEEFREHGTFSRNTAERFRRCILSRGGSKDPGDLYREFRHREPNIEAMMRRDGIPEQNK